MVRGLPRAGADSRRTVGLLLGTALHDACYFGHAEAVQAMVEYRDGLVAATIDAIWQGHRNAMIALVESDHSQGISTHADFTPHQHTCHYGQHAIVGYAAE